MRFIEDEERPGLDAAGGAGAKPLAHRVGVEGVDEQVV